MTVLQIGTDRSIFDEDSASASRMRAYGKRFGKLDIIVFSLRKHNARNLDLNECARAYATDSFSRFLYVWDAARLALKLPKPDVISSQDPFEAGIAGLIAAHLRNVPLHIQVHTDFLSPEYARHSFMNRLRVFVAGFVLRRANRVRVVSGRIRYSLKTKNYKLKTEPTILPIFVDVEDFKNAKIDEDLEKRFSAYKTKLLVVSRLEPEKNVGLAIRAFAKAALEDSCLIIVGDGSERMKLEDLAKRAGVSERMFFEGSGIPIKYYKLADLVLTPSLYEGYGMVAIEALASGVPVISTDVGIAREAGAIITSRENFADALRKWFKNGSRIGELKNYPYKSFEEYVEAYCADIKDSF